MSERAATAYPDQRTAEDVRETLANLEPDRVAGTGNASVVTGAENSTVDLHQAVNPKRPA